MTSVPSSLTNRVRPEQLREASLLFIIFMLITFFATQIDGYFSGTTFTRISTSFAIVAVLANFFPTRRAAGVDPTIALRYQ